MSFESGSFPNCLKTATVTPIFKSGNRNDITCYRPISVVPLLSKIFEKAMAVRLRNYITKFNLISPLQFGFLKGKSTTDAISSFLETIYDALDSKKHTIGVFLDLRKAFDTINHAILCSKLENFGVRGIATSWFSSFLGDRTQKVKVNSCLSELENINIGLPQGTTLAPLLFLIYINDLHNAAPSLSTLLFADDTTLHLSDVSYPNIARTFNNELINIEKYMISNRLSINADKTFAILFTNRPNLIDPSIQLKINNQIISFRDSSKFLGVVIDRKLSFEIHVNLIIQKISKTIGIFYKLKQNGTPKSVLISMYYSLFYPYLLYGNLIWGKTYQVHINKIKLLQKKIIRIICGTEYLAHTNPLFSDCNILKIEDLFTYLCGIHAYKLRISSALETSTHLHNTRGNNQALPRYRRLASSQRSLSYICPTVWNSLSEYIRNSKSLNIFKNNPKSYLLGNNVS